MGPLVDSRHDGKRSNSGGKESMMAEGNTRKRGRKPYKYFSQRENFEKSAWVNASAHVNP